MSQSPSDSWFPHKIDAESLGVANASWWLGGDLSPVLDGVPFLLLSSFWTNVIEMKLEDHISPTQTQRWVVLSSRFGCDKKWKVFFRSYNYGHRIRRHLKLLWEDCTNSPYFSREWKHCSAYVQSTRHPAIYCTSLGAFWIFTNFLALHFFSTQLTIMLRLTICFGWFAFYLGIEPNK